MGTSASPSAVSAPPRLRVLLADDERAIAVTLGDALREAGHEVTVVREGMAAMLALEEGIFDVVVSDVRMPGVDGMEVLRRAKALYPWIEVILITGNGTDASCADALRAGASHCLRKPFYNEKVVELLARLREAPGI